MRSLLLLALVALSTLLVESRLIVRHKREIEREDAVEVNHRKPKNDILVVKETDDNTPVMFHRHLTPLPMFGFGFDRSFDNSDGLILDVNQGDFMLTRDPPARPRRPMHPGFHLLHRGSMFDIMEGLREMQEAMASFGNRFKHPHFGFDFDRDIIPAAEKPIDIDSLPNNYNNTDTEIVTIDGKRYVKKTSLIKQGHPGAMIVIRKIVYEQVDDDENTANAGEEESPEKRPVLPEEIPNKDSADNQPTLEFEGKPDVKPEFNNEESSSPAAESPQDTGKSSDDDKMPKGAEESPESESSTEAKSELEREETTVRTQEDTK